MWDRYRDVPLMLEAYNAGSGRADAFASGRRGLPAETRAYVARIAPELGASGIASRAAAPPPAAPGWPRATHFAARSGTAYFFAKRGVRRRTGRANMMKHE